MNSIPMWTILTMLVLMVSNVEAGWINMNNKLTGRIIHVESLRYRGHWLTSHRGGLGISSVTFTPDDVYSKPRTKFLVRSCDSGTVCLESIHIRGAYIDAHYSGWAQVTPSNHPNNREWAQWKIECWSANLSKCRFLSARWHGQKNYLDSHHSGWVAISSYGSIWSNFRILEEEEKPLIE